MERTGEHLAPAFRVEHSHLPDRGRAGGLAPRPRAEVGGRDRADASGVDGGPHHRVLDLARVAQPLGAREERRKVDGGVDPFVVVLQPELEDVALQGEVADAGGEGKAEQFGHLGRHLPGVGVDGVPAAEHEVVRAGALDRGGQRPGRGERVGTGEGGIGDEDPFIGPERNCLAEHCLGRRRAEGHDGEAATAGAR